MMDLLSESILPLSSHRPQNPLIPSKIKKFSAAKTHSSLETILDQYDLKQFLVKELEELLEGKDEKIKENLRKQEKKAKAIIVNHIADTRLEYIKSEKTVKGVYDKLKSQFERSSISNQLFIRKKLLLMKYNEAYDMNVYLLNFEKTIRQLKEAAGKMEDLDCVCHLLLSLPKSYEAVVAALETLDQQKLTLDFLKSRLMDEYNKRKNQNCATSSRDDSTAFGPSKVKFKYNCYNCGKPGHKRSECRFKTEGHWKKQHKPK
ncbi:hypothetical protein ILUMI_16020, partial [Ignelater luminosus]